MSQIPKTVRHWGFGWNVVGHRIVEVYSGGLSKHPSRWYTELHLERRGRLATKNVEGDWSGQ